MSDTRLSIGRLSFGSARFARMALIGAGVTAALILATGATQGRDPTAVLAAMAQMGGRLHTPDLGPLVAAGIAIQVHVASVGLALAIGVVLIAGLKGNALHRTLGWIWVAAMASAAISSLFIHRANAGGFSVLHLFAGWTLIALPMGVFAARKHNVRLHGRTMTGLFVGGLLVAGAFAFMPGRLMWRMVFG